MKCSWAVMAAVVAVATSCTLPCWQLSAIALLSGAIWMDENWEALLGSADIKEGTL